MSTQNAGATNASTSTTTAAPIRPPIQQQNPRDFAGDAAYHAVKQIFGGEGIDSKELESAAAQVERAVWDAFGVRPGLQWFLGNEEAVQGGTNPDLTVTISLNGKLIRVTHNEGEQGRNNELYGLNWHEFDNLVGRLLTLCDATFTDPIQRKAFKDMVRQHVKEWVTACIVDAAADAGIG